MNRDRQAHALGKIRTILVIILSALVTSMIIELIVSERTNALLQETLQGTTSLVKQVVAPVLPTAPAPVQQAAPSTQPVASNQKPATPLVTSTPVQSTDQTATATTNTMPLMNPNLQKIPFSKATTKQSFNSVRQTEATNEPISSSSFAWLQSTEHGWKVAGIVWYWWLTGISTALAGILVWRRSISVYTLYKLLSKRYILYTE